MSRSVAIPPARSARVPRRRSAIRRWGYSRTTRRSAPRPDSLSVMATVKIPPVLHAAGASVGEVLSALVAAHPATGEQLFSAEGELNRFVNVYLNDEDVRVLDGLQTPVAESDTLVILPAMAGG